jgi:hypothetical protein
MLLNNVSPNEWYFPNTMFPTVCPLYSLPFADDIIFVYDFKYTGTRWDNRKDAQWAFNADATEV